MRRGGKVLILLSVAIAAIISVVILVVIKQDESSTKDGAGVILVSGPESSGSPSSQSPLYSTVAPASPSASPSAVLTLQPSVLISPSPSENPYNEPSGVPNTSTIGPTRFDSPSAALLAQRSSSPSACPTLVASQLLTTFYAIADAPYNAKERADLPKQIKSLPMDAEFLVHLGDIRSAKNFDTCRIAEYERVATMLLKSRVPVFVVVGDNEWNDCPNVNTAWSHWNETFNQFDQNWDHTFEVIRPADRTENFSFVHKKTLFIGLNLVGGRVHKASEWKTRLSHQAEWTKKLILQHTGIDASYETARAIVIFGHATPTLSHTEFFSPLREFIQNQLDKRIPVLYLNGDGHQWRFEPNFFDQSNYLRIQLTGGTSEPPLKIIVNASHSSDSTEAAFSYDRQL